MKKAALLSTLVVAVLLAVGVMAQAQQQTKQPRIGFPLHRVERPTAYGKVSLGNARPGLCRRQKHLIEYRYTEGNAGVAPARRL